MRTANRSLFLVLAFLVSAIAAPSYASDDSPGLLDTVDTTVDTLTAPAPDLSPSVAPKAAVPAKQLTTVVDSALGGHGSLGDLPLVSTVDEALTGDAAVPAAPGLVSKGVAYGEDEQVVASEPLTSVLELKMFSASVPATGALTAESAHIPGTSTLPDGGSPLTLAWLVAWFGVTGAGAVVLRRARA